MPGLNRLAAVGFGVALSVSACSGGSGEAIAPTSTVAPPAEITPTTTWDVYKAHDTGEIDDLCYELWGLGAVLAEDANPEGSILEVQAAIDTSEVRTMDQLADVFGAIATSRMVEPSPDAANPELLDQAKQAVDRALTSNGC